MRNLKRKLDGEISNLENNKILQQLKQCKTEISLMSYLKGTIKLDSNQEQKLLLINIDFFKPMARNRGNNISSLIQNKNLNISQSYAESCQFMFNHYMIRFFRKQNRDWCEEIKLYEEELQNKQRINRELCQEERHLEEMCNKNKQRIQVLNDCLKVMGGRGLKEKVFQIGQFIKDRKTKMEDEIVQKALVVDGSDKKIKNQMK